MRRAPGGACRSGLISPSRRRPDPAHLRSLGYRLDTQDEVEHVCIENGLEPQDLDTHLNGFSWEDSWDNFNSPKRRHSIC